MNMMMGFFGSYIEGLPPSMIPPCGGVRLVLDALAAAEVTVCVT